MTQAEIFAARGDEWNRPNEQGRAERVRQRKDKDGFRWSELVVISEGYGPDGDPVQAQTKVETPYPTRGVLTKAARKRAAEGQRIQQMLKALSTRGRRTL
jgi:hypothetical protein